MWILNYPYKARVDYYTIMLLFILAMSSKLINVGFDMLWS